MAGQEGLKGTGYFSPVATAGGDVIDAAHAENPARAAGWICLSCDQSRKWSRDDFHKAQDYQAFLSILALAKARHPVKLFAFSLMPNHFHFVRRTQGREARIQPRA